MLLLVSIIQVSTLCLPCFLLWMIRHDSHDVIYRWSTRWLSVLSTTKCWLIVSTPHGATIAGCRVFVRDQREQWRQFMLFSVCDHHWEREGGRSDVRKQIVAMVWGCCQEDSAVVRVVPLTLPLIPSSSHLQIIIIIKYYCPCDLQRLVYWERKKTEVKSMFSECESGEKKTTKRNVQLLWP